ncbi:MAG: cytochrome ubiquinol oxidase subunit I [Capsulimonadales bacterium]|nr:cytochrome ubiquinol oxidase subunit I [Capsulimonadales bacterium]
MNYPFWDVPVIGSTWVIGLIAIYHVMISHFAVGGGLYLALAEHKALKENRRDWLPILEKHSKFFLILTGVFGAVSGVGIWFAIGLAHPEATSTLIHNFVFGWAIEWVFFIVELTAAAVYYYTWRRIDDKTHLTVGYIYAGASILTLVIINGILTFMLTPGQTWLSVAGTGQEASKFWYAFFNPTYWPSLLLRVLVCTSLAGVWALVTLSRLQAPQFERTKVTLIRWSASWLIPAFLLMPVCMLWFMANVPASNRGLLQLGMSTIGSGAFTQITRIVLLSVMTTFTISAVVYFFAYKSPRDFAIGHAVSVLGLALAATASTEYAREALRKPYVIGQHMYSNGIRVSEIEKFNREGYLAQSVWGQKARADGDSLKIGEAMYRGQCMNCHTNDGYRSMRRLLADRNTEAIASLLTMLHEPKPDSPYARYMPPLVGTPEEVNGLAEYLATLAAPSPDHSSKPVVSASVTAH